MKTESIYSKIFICSYFIIILFFDKSIFSESTKTDFTIYLKNYLRELHDSHDMYEEDLVLQEVYSIGDDLYKKIIEMVALFYCKNFISDADLLFDKMLIDISKDALKIIKLIAKYIPLLCKNKKIPLFVKVKKIIIASCVVGVLIELLKWFTEQKLVYNQYKEIIKNDIVSTAQK